MLRGGSRNGLTPSLSLGPSPYHHHHPHYSHLHLVSAICGVMAGYLLAPHTCSSPLCPAYTLLQEAAHRVGDFTHLVPSPSDCQLGLSQWEAEAGVTRRKAGGRGTALHQPCGRSPAVPQWPASPGARSRQVALPGPWPALWQQLLFPASGPEWLELLLPSPQQQRLFSSLLKMLFSLTSLLRTLTA